LIFIEALKTKESQLLIDKFLKFESPSTANEVTDMAKSISDIICQAAEKSLREKTKMVKKNVKRNWGRHFDKDCSRALHEVKKLGRKVAKNPTNSELRKLFYRQK
jgi:hypothetical protein